MRTTNAEDLLSEAFPARIEAVEALRAAATNADADGARLKEGAGNLRGVANRYGRAPNAIVYEAFAEAMHIAGLLCEWRQNVLNAGTDVQRFLTAAKERSTAWLTTYGKNSLLQGLQAVAEAVATISAISDVQSLIGKLANVPLPVGVYRMPPWESIRQRMATKEAEERPPELAVAFLTFSIDGRPLNEIHYVSPGETHDIDVEVRVSRWPVHATKLLLEPITVEQPGSYELPSFTLDAPFGETGPFRLKAHGRFNISIPQYMAARPFEFIYAARFVPTGVEQPVEVVGQRTLQLEGCDIARDPLTGYENIDRKLIDVRNTLRLLQHVGQSELSDALTLCFALGNYAGQLIQDNTIKETVDEAEFQKRLKSFLRSHPRIGSKLEEHAHVAGGISDLSFFGIRLELKSEKNHKLKLSDCDRYLGQAATYAVGSGKRIAILCVLDCSKKTEPPFPAEDGITVFPLQLADGSPVYVITFLLQGNLPLPSDLSR